MPKINRGYISPFEYLYMLWVELEYSANGNETWREMNLFNYPRYNSSKDTFNAGNSNSLGVISGLKFILGGFQPLADMYKDFVDTFKPYKSQRYYVLRDLSQPLYGLKNIAKGIGCLILAPLLFLLVFAYICFCGICLLRNEN